MMAFWIILLVLHAASALKVYSSGLETLKPDYRKGLRLRNPPQDLTIRDFSMCIRFNMYTLHEIQLVEAMKYRETPDGVAFYTFSLYINSNSKNFDDINYFAFLHWYRFHYRFNPLIWNHLCLSFNYEARQSMIVLNEKLVLNVTDSKLPRENHPPKELFEWLWIGKPAIGYDSGGALVGKVSDFNVWLRPLSYDEMMDWTSCVTSGGGDFIDWESEEWLNEFNMTESIETLASMCTPHVPGYVSFPHKANFYQAKEMCHQFGGPLAVPHDEGEVDLLIEKWGDDQKPCGRSWVGIWDEPKEGTWTDANNGELVKYTNWVANFPDGDRIENCATISGIGGYNDLPCVKDVCSICELPERTLVQIRGNCLGSNLDSRYVWTEDKKDSYFALRGVIHSEIRWHEEESMWKIQSEENVDTYAFFNGSTTNSIYPLGKNTWTFIGEPCYMYQPTDVTIQINRCTSTEFACDDGTCIPIGNRCNRRADCADNSDEINCRIAILADEYLLEYPPLGPTGNIELEVNVNLYNIMDLDEVLGTFRSQFELKLSWYDSRLKFYNLKSETKNILSRTEQHEIWLPVVVFDNTPRKVTTQNDLKTFISVNKTGQYRLSAKDQADNIYIYEGSENPLTASRIYNTEFLCEYYLAYYPFDNQQCSMVFSMEGDYGSFVDLVPGVFLYEGPIDLTVYFVRKIEMVSHQMPDKTKGIKIEIILGRRLLGVFLVTYVPTFLLLVIVYTTHFYRRIFFEGVVTVNLTAMLVMTTMFIGTSSSLPATSYTKMIDIWMIFGLVFSFFNVILHVSLEYFRDFAGLENAFPGKIKGSNLTPVRPFNDDGDLPAPKSKDKKMYGENKKDKLVLYLEAAGKKGMLAILILFPVVYFIFGSIVQQRDLSG